MSIIPVGTIWIKICSSEVKWNFDRVGQKLVPMSIIPDEQKMLPSELKDVEFKIGQVTFYSGWTKNVTIRNNFILDEQKLLTTELILFWMKKKFYHPN